MTAPLGGHTRDPEQLPKVKGPDDEDMHVFAQAGKIKKKSLFGVAEITFEGRCGMTLSFEVGALAWVEATIFIRVIDGTWTVGFHGEFAARTTSSRNEIILNISV